MLAAKIETMKPARIVLVIVAIALVGAAGWMFSRTPPQRPPETVPSLPAENVVVGGAKVTLYFADGEASLLVPVQRQLDDIHATAKSVIKELIAGLQPGETGESALPKGTELLDVSLSDGVATVNLNRAFQTDFPSSSAASLLAVYSIVNTLTELPAIDGVAFQIEGKPVSTLGPLDVSGPLARRPDMIP